MRALLAMAAVMLPAAHARADEELPDSRIAMLGGVRHGTGAVSDDIGFGTTLGVEAAWQPMDVGQRLGWSISWSLLWGWFGDEPAARVTGSLTILELDLALRARLAPTPAPGRCLTFGVGGALVRSNEPLPPDDTRDYLGPFAEVGYEHLAYDVLTATFHLRLGPLSTGPPMLSGVLGIGFAL
jgi:hypothetical protein